MTKLEKLGVIKRCKCKVKGEDEEKVIIINPSYFMVGSKLPSWIYDMFGYDKKYIDKAYKGGGNKGG